MIAIYSSVGQKSVLESTQYSSRRKDENTSQDMWIDSKLAQTLRMFLIDVDLGPETCLKHWSGSVTVYTSARRWITLPDNWPDSKLSHPHTVCEKMDNSSRQLTSFKTLSPTHRLQCGLLFIDLISCVCFLWSRFVSSALFLFVLCTQ